MYTIICWLKVPMYLRRQYNCHVDENRPRGRRRGHPLVWQIGVPSRSLGRWLDTSISTNFSDKNYNTNKRNANVNLLSRRQDKHQDTLSMCLSLHYLWSEVCAQSWPMHGFTQWCRCCTLKMCRQWGSEIHSHFRLSINKHKLLTASI